MSGVRPEGLPEWVQVGARVVVADSSSGIRARLTRVARFTATQVVTDTGERFRIGRGALVRVGDSGTFMAPSLYRGDETEAMVAAVAELHRIEDCARVEDAASMWRRHPSRRGELQAIVEFADKYRHLLNEEAGR